MKFLISRNSPRGKPSLFLLLAFIFCLPSLGIGGNMPDSAYMTRSFKWDYAGKSYSFSYKFPQDLYNYYQEKPRVFTYIQYTHESPGYGFIADFTDALKEKAQETDMNDWETINFFVSFVQALEYLRETKSPEYPKFPIETLIDAGGDCEDTAILLSAMLDELGYEAILVSPPGHMAVGIAGEDLPGSYYNLEGKKYYFIETTGENWDIGQIPEKYTGTADLYALNRSQGDKDPLAVDLPDESNNRDTESELGFIFRMSSVGENSAYANKTAYTYSIQMSGDHADLSKIAKVRYRRMHKTFPEYNTNSWITKTSSGNRFHSQWKGWGYTPILIQVEFVNGHVEEYLLEVPPSQN